MTPLPVEVAQLVVPLVVEQRLVVLLVGGARCGRRHRMPLLLVLLLVVLLMPRLLLLLLRLRLLLLQIRRRLPLWLYLLKGAIGRHLQWRECAPLSAQQQLRQHAGERSRHARRSIAC
jgi:hypothetical protein